MKLLLNHRYHHYLLSLMLVVVHSQSTGDTLPRTWRATFYYDVGACNGSNVVTSYFTYEGTNAKLSPCQDLGQPPSSSTLTCASWQSGGKSGPFTCTDKGFEVAKGVRVRTGECYLYAVPGCEGNTLIVGGGGGESGLCVEGTSSLGVGVVSFECRVER
ncbi:uncharacterized protein GGS25DRAFT_70612 [Hypoxylon fragiforme]|uniref:uncharacterized protein n=1 Tax=Hypoxylon fragiforme TaxID=63214 RepID=UPI0020C719F2|nr:uncharacterized protein GGS25DRAFT_70612 [Hypoxylon fragiforme]KAI2602890.1 hypothetical protein GGS25DRAFT_70612 [Hypoxylon fragiforme]